MFRSLFKTILRGLIDCTLPSYWDGICWYMFVIKLCGLWLYVISFRLCVCVCVCVCVCLVFLTEWNLVMECVQWNNDVQRRDNWLPRVNSNETLGSQRQMSASCKHNNQLCCRRDDCVLHVNSHETVGVRYKCLPSANRVIKLRGLRDN